MDVQFLRQMLYSGQAKSQSGIIIWHSQRDYELYKDTFKNEGCFRFAVANAMDGIISTVNLRQITSRKIMAPLVVPITHCLTSSAKFSAALEKINSGKYEGPFMFLPTCEEPYDPKS